MEKISMKSKPCVYGWQFNEKIVYVGKTKNLLKRTLSHLEDSRRVNACDYNSPKYKFLREFQEEVEVVVLDNDMSKEMEWIKRLDPILNVQRNTTKDGK